MRRFPRTDTTAFASGTAIMIHNPKNVLQKSVRMITRNAIWTTQDQSKCNEGVFDWPKKNDN